jgi:hypothetical protein
MHFGHAYVPAVVIRFAASCRELHASGLCSPELTGYPREFSATQRK